MLRQWNTPLSLHDFIHVPIYQSIIKEIKMDLFDQITAQIKKKKLSRRCHIISTLTQN